MAHSAGGNVLHQRRSSGPAPRTRLWIRAWISLYQSPTRLRSPPLIRCAVTNETNALRPAMAPAVTLY